MATLVVINREGVEQSIDVPPGRSVMESVRDGGFDELLALCGGCCSCATCHVYVDDGFAGMLPPITDDESDLLDGSLYRTAQSRLSCQLPFTEALSGLKVTIAPED